MFSLTWPAFMQIYWNKRKRLHKKGVQLPQDWFGTSTWPPFNCFGTPIWPPWCHVKTLYWQNLALSLINLLPFLHSRSYIYRRLKDTPPIAKMQKMWFITSFKEIDGTKNAVFSWFLQIRKVSPTQFERWGERRLGTSLLTPLPSLPRHDRVYQLSLRLQRSDTTELEWDFFF